MSTRIVLAVGHRCATDSKIARNTPLCVKVWPIGTENKEVLIGTAFKEDFAPEVINLVDFNKEEVLVHFEDFKSVVRQASDSEGFSSEKSHQEWLKSFDEAEVSIVALVSE